MNWWINKKYLPTYLPTYLHTVFTQISAAAPISFLAPQVRCLFEGGAYLKIVPDKFTFSIFLFNGTLSTP